MRRPYYGWVVAAASFLGTFVVFGLSYSFAVFLERIVETFGGSRGLSSLAFGVQTLAIYVGASVLGVLIDRYGTHRMLLVGTLLTAGGLAAASRAGSLPVLILTYGVVTGVGLSIVYVVAYATVTRWFDRRLGLAGGLSSAGLGVGMFIVVPSAAWLIARLGWRDVLLALAAVSGALLLLATVLVRDDPVSAGVDPPPEEFVGAPPTPNREPLREQYAAVRGIALTRSFGLLFVGWVLVYGTLYAVLAHLVLYAEGLGLPAAVGPAALAVVGLTSALGRVAIGHVADTAGRLRVFVTCSAAMGLATLGLVAAGSTLGVVAFAVGFGLAYGGNGALLSPLTAELFGREQINAVFGLLSMAFAVSGLIAPLAAGATYDQWGSYEPAFLVAGLAALVGAGAVWLAGRRA
ncbi:MFS transporter [Halolamina salifodinae]|uniref:MFS family permease n=1 Tax=Halolamina salifodinae TaxID=1202767 RepID=A0A8T4GUE3_9EURY|nr:MFS transporter [Halolamina salifodinae]MBP1986506.1 MFS family permease [Halolamina salifodinae]